MSYLSKWPESFVGTCFDHLMYHLSTALDLCIPFRSFRSWPVAESPHGSLMGYVLGKAEGDGPLWHGHVSALTVAPEYRRLGLAKTLMEKFEDICVHAYDAYFVDLFVRSSNALAIRMYEGFGYCTYRRVLGYYSGELPEDALDMRKALPRCVPSRRRALLFECFVRCVEGLYAISFLARFGSIHFAQGQAQAEHRTARSSGAAGGFGMVRDCAGSVGTIRGHSATSWSPPTPPVMRVVHPGLPRPTLFADLARIISRLLQCSYGCY